MNILLITTHLNTGGITSYLLSLAQSLKRRGHKVFVVSAGGNCEGLLKSYGVEHVNLGFRTKSEIDLRIYLKLSHLKEFIVKNNVDVIHAQTRVTQVMGYFLSKITKRPLITTCHGFFKPRFSRRIFPCWGEAVIAISKPVYSHLLKDFHVPSQKVYLISNGIDCDRFMPVTEEIRQQKRRQWNISSSLRVIGIIARLSDVKGVDVLLKTMPFVIEQHPDTLLMVVGEGPEKERLLTLAQSLNLNDRVRFESIVNQTADLLPVFDIFVMPSRQEGLGLAVMEAQASALPVVASYVGGLVDLIEDGRTGYLVSPENPKALAQKIIEVLKDMVKAKQIGLAAREVICHKFSSEQMAKATEEVYAKYSRR